MAENKMRPISLVGHERPLTKIRINREGDLLFTCAKEKAVCVWFTDNGERLGTYGHHDDDVDKWVGHEGTVWDCDVDWNSKYLLTASADRTARLWEVRTGECLRIWQHDSSCKLVRFAHGDGMFLSVQDDTYKATPTLFVFKVDPLQEVKAASEPLFTIPMKSKAVGAEWGPLNQTIITAHDDGFVRQWDAKTQELLTEVKEHKAAIKNMQISADGSMIITSSSDHTARLWETRTVKCLKTYQTDHPVNDACISPVMNHVILGGGQEAMSVTTTSHESGHFEAEFYHLVMAEYMGSIKGHFGPINTLAFSRDGKIYISGAEDGYVRIHHFPKGYFRDDQKQW
jgi:translation initiation factor 3 subunit I